MNGGRKESYGSGEVLEVDFDESEVRSEQEIILPSQETSEGNNKGSGGSRESWGSESEAELLSSSGGLVPQKRMSPEAVNSRKNRKNKGRVKELMKSGKSVKSVKSGKSGKSLTPPSETQNPKTYISSRSPPTPTSPQTTPKTAKIRSGRTRSPTSPKSPSPTLHAASSASSALPPNFTAPLPLLFSSNKAPRGTSNYNSPDRSKSGEQSHHSNEDHSNEVEIGIGKSGEWASTPMNSNSKKKKEESDAEAEGEINSRGNSIPPPPPPPSTPSPLDLPPTFPSLSTSIPPPFTQNLEHCIHSYPSIRTYLLYLRRAHSHKTQIAQHRHHIDSRYRGVWRVNRNISRVKARLSAMLNAGRKLNLLYDNLLQVEEGFEARFRKVLMFGKIGSGVDLGLNGGDANKGRTNLEMIWNLLSWIKGDEGWFGEKVDQLNHLYECIIGDKNRIPGYDNSERWEGKIAKIYGFIKMLDVSPVVCAPRREVLKSSHLTSNILLYLGMREVSNYRLISSWTNKQYKISQTLLKQFLQRIWLPPTHPFLGELLSVPQCVHKQLIRATLRKVRMLREDLGAGRGGGGGGGGVQPKQSPSPSNHLPPPPPPPPPSKCKLLPMVCTGYCNNIMRVREWERGEAVEMKGGGCWVQGMLSKSTKRALGGEGFALQPGGVSLRGDQVHLLHSPTTRVHSPTTRVLELALASKLVININIPPVSNPNNPNISPLNLYILLSPTEIERGSPHLQFLLTSTHSTMLTYDPIPTHSLPPGITWSRIPQHSQMLLLTLANFSPTNTKSPEYRKYISYMGGGNTPHSLSLFLPSPIPIRHILFVPIQPHTNCIYPITYTTLGISFYGRSFTIDLGTSCAFCMHPIENYAKGINLDCACLVCFDCIYK